MILIAFIIKIRITSSNDMRKVMLRENHLFGDLRHVRRKVDDSCSNVVCYVSP